MKNSINGIECKDKNTGKIVTAYHIEENGAAHNKENNLCIGCIGVDLIPIDVTAHSPAQGKGEEKAKDKVEYLELDMWEGI